MDWKTFAAAFGTIFLAEMGDKTQLAAITMTASTKKPLSIFLGGALALTCVTAIGVVFGEGIVRVIPETVLKRIVAAAFVVIGVWMFARP
jgi:putative Ca2+/H+ antiporter (TMEM165/GDT1 family)